MKLLFSVPAEVADWHRAALGRNPFPCDAGTAASSFFRPAARLCRKAVPAEKALPSSIPSPLREKIGLALRFWQVSQKITEDFVLRGKLLPVMDMPMTLNFAMALGNYSRAFLFFGLSRLGPGTKIALYSAFTKEMTEMPAAMAARRAMKGRTLSSRDVIFAERHTPEASAFRLAGVCAAVLKKSTYEN